MLYYFERAESDVRKTDAVLARADVFSDIRRAKRTRKNAVFSSLCPSTDFTAKRTRKNAVFSSLCPPQQNLNQISLPMQNSARLPA